MFHHTPLTVTDGVSDPSVMNCEEDAVISIQSTPGITHSSLRYIYIYRDIYIWGGIESEN